MDTKRWIIQKYVWDIIHSCENEKILQDLLLAFANEYKGTSPITETMFCKYLADKHGYNAIPVSEMEEIAQSLFN